MFWFDKKSQFKSSTKKIVNLVHKMDEAEKEEKEEEEEVSSELNLNLKLSL